MADRSLEITMGSYLQNSKDSLNFSGFISDFVAEKHLTIL